MLTRLAHRTLLRVLQESGRIASSIDVVALAPILLASIDGLQIQ